MIAQDTVLPGENIVSLASRLYGDPAMWPDLVTLNGLRAPYLGDVPAPGVLMPGDRVLYTTVAAAVTALNLSELEALTYRRDWMVEGGDLVIGPGGPVIEVGLDNLRRALERRLRYALGSHPFHPLTWGSLLRAQLGTVADEARLSLMCSDARRALLGDPRVQAADVDAAWADDALDLSCAVTPIAPGTVLRFDLRV